MKAKIKNKIANFDRFFMVKSVPWNCCSIILGREILLFDKMWAWETLVETMGLISGDWWPWEKYEEIRSLWFIKNFEYSPNFYVSFRNIQSLYVVLGIAFAFIHDSITYLLDYLLIILCKTNKNQMQLEGLENWRFAATKNLCKFLWKTTGNLCTCLWKCLPDLIEMLAFY